MKENIKVTEAVKRAEWSNDLVIENLSKTYPGGVCALSNISLTVRNGCISSLLGPNGAGKTTLVHCIGGLVLPEAGRIMYRGQDILKHPSLARKSFAILFEEAENVYGYLTVEENIRYFCYLNRVNLTRLSSSLNEYLELMGLREKRNKVVFELSRGMKQKLALIIAFLKGADLLILDEPTLGLDIQSRQQIIGFLKSLCTRYGKTILLTTHDMGLAQELSDHFFFIKEGQLIWQGSRSELAKIFGVDEMEFRKPLPLEQVFVQLMESRVDSQWRPG